MSVSVGRVIVGGTDEKQDDDDVVCFFVVDCCVALLRFISAAFFALPFEEEREQEVAANIKEWGQNFPPCRGLIGGSMVPLPFCFVGGNFLWREKTPRQQQGRTTEQTQENGQADRYYGRKDRLLGNGFFST